MHEKKNGLWYVSQPSRLGGSGKEEYREQVLKDLIYSGYDVIHPFNAFPYDHFEGNKAIGRDLAMKYCCDLVGMCEGRILVTGISEGVLMEVEYASKNFEAAQIILFPQYDPEWYERIQEFRVANRFELALARIGQLSPKV